LEILQACTEKQGIACEGRVWNSFPYWNTRIADDASYFTDEEMECKDPALGRLACMKQSQTDRSFLQ